MTDQSNCAVDTSVAVPLLAASHVAHRAVRLWAANRSLVLCGHALAETYSVLTRLPGDARLAPADAALLIDENFIVNLPLSPEAAAFTEAEATPPVAARPAPRPPATATGISTGG